MPRRLRLLLAALLACVLALAGCVSMPRSGPVTASDPDLPVPQIGFAASGPLAGAGPVDVVKGFVEASAAGLSDDFTVAREYLAGQAQTAWDPTAQVRVYSSDEAVEYTRTDTGAVQVRAPAEATVDDDGRYTEAAPESAILSEFTLARDGAGEWRIISLEDGILVSPAVFDVLFTDIHLYFLSQDREVLVPDQRYFPLRNVPTSAVSNLLAGPSPWLAPGVTTALPSGTSLAVGSVVVDEGVAEVDLSNEFLSASATDQALAVAQISATLENVPAIQRVEVTVRDVPLDLAAPVPSLEQNVFVPANPVVVTEDGALARYSGANEPAEVVPAQALAGRTPNAPAMGYGEEPTIVLRGGATDLLLVDGDDVLTLARGTDLVPPSVDRHRWVWTGERTNRGALRAVAVDGSDVTVSVPWLEGAQVRSVKVSRDGSRAVVVSATGGVVRVAVAAVAREANGRPTSLGEPVPIAERLDDALDVTWVSEVDVAVLGTPAGGTGPTVQIVPLGGRTETLAPVTGATSITAGRGARTLIVGTAEAELYVRSGSSWRLAVDGVRDPAYPG